MSAKIAVLGLVIEEPGPAHRLTAKLRQRLASARFVDSNVYSALARLARDGLIRATEREQPEGRPGGGPADGDAGRPDGSGAPADGDAGRPDGPGAPADGDAGRPDGPGAPADGDARSFEATPAGVEHFERWLLSSSTAPPLRDELHMKVAFCQPQNLPRLVELMRGQELMCLTHANELRRSFAHARRPAPDRWSGLVMAGVRDAELAFWETRLTWLQGVRESLEAMFAEYECATRGGVARAHAGG